MKSTSTRFDKCDNYIENKFNEYSNFSKDEKILLWEAFSEFITDSQYQSLYDYLSMSTQNNSKTLNDQAKNFLRKLHESKNISDILDKNGFQSVNFVNDEKALIKIWVLFSALEDDSLFQPKPIYFQSQSSTTQELTERFSIDAFSVLIVDDQYQDLLHYLDSTTERNHQNRNKINDSCKILENSARNLLNEIMKYFQDTTKTISFQLSNKNALDIIIELYQEAKEKSLLQSGNDQVNTSQNTENIPEHASMLDKLHEKLNGSHNLLKGSVIQPTPELKVLFNTFQQEFAKIWMAFPKTIFSNPECFTQYSDEQINKALQLLAISIKFHAKLYPKKLDVVQAGPKLGTYVATLLNDPNIAKTTKLRFLQYTVSIYQKNCDSNLIEQYDPQTIPTFTDNLDQYEACFAGLFYWLIYHNNNSSTLNFNILTKIMVKDALESNYKNTFEKFTSKDVVPAK